MKAVVVGKEHRLVLGEVEDPTPQRSEALVRVTAISLNRGESMGCSQSPRGRVPAGILPASSRSVRATGQRPGDRHARGRHTAHRGVGGTAVCAPSHAVAALPDGGQQTRRRQRLPVAGLTALHALPRQGGLLLGRKVLVEWRDGRRRASCRAARRRRQGPRCMATCDARSSRRCLPAWCGRPASSWRADLRAAASERTVSFDTRREPLGVASADWRRHSRCSQPNGTCVTFGISAEPQATIAISPFYMIGGARIFGLALFHELARRERAQRRAGAACGPDRAEAAEGSTLRSRSRGPRSMRSRAS